MLNKISKKAAGIGIILMNIFTIIIFLLIILKVLPYNVISGGRLESYEAACQTAITSIILIIPGILYAAIASGLIKWNFIKVWLWVSFISICFNIIANLLGATLFEKIVMTLVCIVQAILFLRLAKDKG